MIRGRIPSFLIHTPLFRCVDVWGSRSKYIVVVERSKGEGRGQGISNFEGKGLSATVDKSVSQGLWWPLKNYQTTLPSLHALRRYPRKLFCCCCCCPGLGNTLVVGTWSTLIPPRVPELPAFCHPWPVCWFTNALCRKGFVLPVACTVRPPCGGAMAFCGDGCRANGFVPVGEGCSGCSGGCCCCGCCMGAKGED